MNRQLLFIMFLMQHLTFAHIGTAEGNNGQLALSNEDASARASYSDLPLDEVKERIVGFLSGNTVEEIRALKSLEQVSHADQKAVKEFGPYLNLSEIEKLQDKILYIRHYFYTLPENEEEFKANEEEFKANRKIQRKIDLIGSGSVKKPRENFIPSYTHYSYRKEPGIYRYAELLNMDKVKKQQFIQKGEEILREAAPLMEKYQAKIDERVFKAKRVNLLMNAKDSWEDFQIDLGGIKRYLESIKKMEEKVKLDPKLHKRINQFSDHLEKVDKHKRESIEIISGYKKKIEDSKNLVELNQLIEEITKDHQEKNIPVACEYYTKRSSFLKMEMKEFVEKNLKELEEKYSKLKRLREYYEKELPRILAKKQLEIDGLHKKALAEGMSSEFIDKVAEQHKLLGMKYREIFYVKKDILQLEQSIEAKPEYIYLNKAKEIVRLESLKDVEKVEEKLKEQVVFLESEESEKKVFLGINFPGINFLKQELEEHIVRKQAIKQEVGASSMATSSHSEIGKTHAPLRAEEHDQYENIGNEIEIKVEKIDEHAREHEHPSVSEHAAHNSEHLHE